MNRQPRVVPATEARQGVTRHNVRYVLNISLALAILAGVAIYLIYVR